MEGQEKGYDKLKNEVLKLNKTNAILEEEEEEEDLIVIPPKKEDY